MADPIPVRLAALEEHTALVARNVDGDPPAAAAAPARNSPAAPVTLVVAGETSRGKTSLVNALVGIPGLLPTGADVTTNVYVTLRAGGPRVIVQTADGTFEANPDELRRWTTVGGRLLSDPQAVSVEVDTPSPLLERGLAIIDTPGVGGLDEAHASATMVALEQADALLFVLDARAPIGAPERAFLERAAARIETVLFVVAKRDSFPGWATVHDQTRSFIEAHVPRFANAPVVATSTVDLAQAELVEADDPALAAEMRADAGFDRVRDEIVARVIEPGELLRDANRVRAAENEIERLRAKLEATMSAAVGDDVAARALAATRARLTQLQGPNGPWRQKVFDEFSSLTRRAKADFQHQLIAIESDLMTLTDARQLESYPGQLEERLAGALISVNATLASGVTRISAEVWEALRVVGVTIDAPALAPLAASVKVGPPTTPGETQAEQVVGIGRQVLSAMGPMTFLNYASSLPFMAGLGAFAPMGLAIGLTMAVVDRRRLTARTSLQVAQKQWSDAWRLTMRSMTFDIPNEIEDRLTAVRQQLVRQSEEAIKSRDGEIKAEIGRLDTISKSHATARQEVANDAGTHLGALAKLAARAADLRRDIKAAGASRAISPSVSMAVPIGIVAPGEGEAS